MSTRIETTKAPRWITTEAGQWAYIFNPEWRQHADRAFGVAERRRLLDEAERLRRAAATDSTTTDAA
ncbi:MAG: hypothetical protein RMK84_15505 [Oscillochloridaceae bacterium]|nr:hypothetical protein [Chloroflexaceae bacterium]MDW8391530.1 hypothetical protein [Oscillochloridaceae bacterium]